MANGTTAGPLWYCRVRHLDPTQSPRQMSRPIRVYAMWENRFTARSQQPAPSRSRHRIRRRRRRRRVDKSFIKSASAIGQRWMEVWAQTHGRQKASLLAAGDTTQSMPQSTRVRSRSTAGREEQLPSSQQLSHRDGQDDHQDGGNNNGKDGGDIPDSGGQKDGTRTDARLACPFFARRPDAPVAHPSCSLHPVKSMSRLKQVTHP